MKKKPTQKSQPKLLIYGLSILFAVGAFLRLWNFTNTLQFLGDQGRDAIIVKGIIKDFNPVLIGPVTSTGNMYLGPLYYYFIAPFLWLTYPSPIGPAYAVAFVSIAALVAMYYWGKEMLGEKTALFATFFFSISAVVVLYSRFSWNPNPEPFVGLLLLWSIYRALTKNPWYWALSAVCISVLIQLHYVALLTIPATGLFWLSSAVQKLRAPRKTQADQAELKKFVLTSLVSLGIFLLSFSPLVLFDMRHDYLNARSFQKFISEENGPVINNGRFAQLWKVAKETHGRSLQALFEITIGQNRWLNTALLVGVLGMMTWLVTRRQNNEFQLGQRIIFTFFIVSIIGLSFYQGSVFPHYIAYLFPVTFFMFGIILSELWKKSWGKILAAVFVVGFSYWNITNLPLQDLGWKVTDMKRTSQTILDRVKPGEKYNIVLLSETKDLYGQNYRYFLVVSDKPPVHTDDFATADTLFIINEQHLKGDIIHLPIYEIQTFPSKIPTEVYTVQNGPEITVLKR